MNIVRSILCCIGAFGAMTSLGGSSSALPGWSSDYSGSLKAAQDAHKPYVLFWGNTGCDHCETLAEAVQTTAFRTWQKDTPYSYCYVLGINGKDPSGAKGAKEFAGTAGGTLKKSLSSYPFVCLYWLKRDGTVSAKSFVGRYGDIPGRGLTLDAQMIDAIETFFADYKAEADYAFAVDGSNAWDRYEAEPGHTTYVDVKISRTFGESRDLTFACMYPDAGKPVVTTFSWDELAENERTLRVTIPADATSDDIGKRILLALQDEEGKTLATSSIWYCQPENGSNNPLWKDERTFETLSYGEWTADMDTATQKVAAVSGEAWTLLELAGSLWCPDCYRTDVNFLEDGEKVKDWARANNVMLVSVDTPHNSAANPDLLTGTIWNRESDLSKLIIAPFENPDTEKVARSGKGYLSRKMISDDEALAVAEQNLLLSREYYHRPEDYAAHRTLIPIFILLDKAGRVVGRFETFDARSCSPTNRAHTAQYLQRFDEMIAQARQSADPAGEVLDNHWSTTTRHVAADEAVDGRLSHADYHDVYRLDDVTAGRLELVLSGSSATPMNVFVIEISDGEETILGAAYGDISAGVRLSCLVDGSSDYYARVFCNKGDDSVPADPDFAATTAASTVRDYHLSVAVVPTPGIVSFDESSLRFNENQGTGLVTLSREDGATGTASVQVNVAAASANAEGRYVWNNPVVTWVDGESGTKQIPFELVRSPLYEGPATVTLQLQAMPGCAAEVSGDHAVVTIIDSDEPAFDRAHYDVTAFEGIALSESFGLVNIEDPSKVTLKKLSASDALPKGLSIKYDKKTCSVILKGTPKEACMRTLRYALCEKRKSGTVVGEATSIVVSVGDPKLVNPYIGVKRTSQVLPLKCTTDAGVFLGGTLTCSITANNKISAKYIGTASRTYSFSGSWADIDSKNGEASTALVRGDATLVLKLSAKGVLAAEMVLPAEECYFADSDSSFVSLQGSAAAPGADLSAYAGFYTVQLPHDANTGADALSSGSAYLTFDFSTAALQKSGQVKFAGKLPDGKSVSGKAALSLITEPDREGRETTFARLAVFMRSSKYVFAGLFKILPDAADTWKSPAASEALPVIFAAEDVIPYHIIRGTVENREQFEVYGSYFERKLSPAQLCDLFSLNTTLDVNVLGEGTVSEHYGEVLSVPRATLYASGSSFATDDIVGKLKIKYAAKTGEVSGSGQIVFSGKTLSGKFAGITMPGWVDCQCGAAFTERPFAAGTFWFTDSVLVGARWISFVRSIPMELKVRDSAK